MAAAPTVPCGIAIPQVFPDRPIDMGLVRDYVVRAEELGYHSLWVQEQIIGGTSSLEPISLLNYVAAITDKIREQFGLRWAAVGVVVTLVDPEKAKAKKVDLQRGEVIIQVNQKDIWDPRQLMDMYKEAKEQGRKYLLLLVEGVKGYRPSVIPVE